MKCHKIVFWNLYWVLILLGKSKVDGAVRKTPKLVTAAPSSVPETGGKPESSKSSSSSSLSHDQQDLSQSGNQGLNQLLDLIFGSYHKELVPKRPTTIKLDLLLLKVKSTIEKEGIFESVIALFMEWQDARMKWDPRQYDNVSILAFDSDKVWLPDIAMTNSADHLYSISKDTRFVVRVTHQGMMKFVPTGTARTWCDLRLLTFPFDIQTCTFEFESWSLDSSTMTFNRSSEALVDDAFSSPQWELCSRSALVYDHFYNFTGEIFTRVRFDFVVRRKSTFYIINLIFPCATLSMIQLLVFVIPSTDSTSDRVGFGTTNLLTLVVFQTIVTAEMPKSSDAVTALSKYIIALIIISAVGIFESVIAERLLRTTTTPPPQWVVKVMSIIPLLWGSQLPSGIGQMILEGSDCNNDKTSLVQKKQLLAIDQPPPNNNKMAGEGPKNNGGVDLCSSKQTLLPYCYSGSNNSTSYVNDRSNKAPVAEQDDMLWVPMPSGDSLSLAIPPDNKMGKGNKRRVSKPRLSMSLASNSTLSRGRFMTVPSNGSNRFFQPRRRSKHAQPSPLFGVRSGTDDERSMVSGRLSFRGATDYDSYLLSMEQNSTNNSRRGQNNQMAAGSVMCAASGDLVGNKSDLIGLSSPSSQGLRAYRDCNSNNNNNATMTRASVNLSVCSSTNNFGDEGNKNDQQPADDEAIVQDQLMRVHNGLLWGELVTKIDHVIFVSCMALALCIPGFLFVPLMAFSECGDVL